MCGNSAAYGHDNEIDLSQQPQGVYILKATTGTQHQIVKIVKQ
ncbi:MAG: T9SS type A sorting domain-containing protein [Sphingobacteriales bacterium]|nr:T9SS type A sorting domain-containing protein [Sphingobacteriales bacterium]